MNYLSDTRLYKHVITPQTLKGLTGILDARIRKFTLQLHIKHVLFFDSGYIMCFVFSNFRGYIIVTV